MIQNEENLTASLLHHQQSKQSPRNIMKIVVALQSVSDHGVIPWKATEHW